MIKVLNLFSLMRHARFILWCSIGITSIFAHTVSAQQIAMSDAQIESAVRQLETNFPKGSIDSMSMVGNVIQLAAKTKADLQQWYLQSEQGCYERFFVTACLNKLRVDHVRYNDSVQRVLIEAKAFQRKHHIEELDEALRVKQESKNN